MPAVPGGRQQGDAGDIRNGLAVAPGAGTRRGPRACRAVDDHIAQNELVVDEELYSSAVSADAKRAIAAAKCSSKVACIVASVG
jgi:hypothetical protein